jgi:glutaconate CoA-transferase, subunit A
VSARVATLQEALATVEDGCVLGVGGATLARKPMAAIRELARAGLRDLELVAFTGSLDVELLVRAGAVAAVRSSHVSLGAAGPAGAFAEAVEAGMIEDLEESEWMLLGRLRAAAAGLAFMPTRAAIGSDLVRARGLREVGDPYNGDTLLALPPLRPDVALIHAWRADPLGNVQVPWPPDHLWDVDLLLARAARHAVVTTDNLVSTDDVAASGDRTMLFGFEVAAVVETARGAAPTASPPDYPADLARVASEAAAILYPNGPARAVSEECR